MTCPDSDKDCDNPGCRHGGCQGRPPQLPLFRVAQSVRRAPAPIGNDACGETRPIAL
jgi:hypothetical protein